MELTREERAAAIRAARRYPKLKAYQWDSEGALARYDPSPSKLPPKSEHG